MRFSIGLLAALFAGCVVGIARAEDPVACVQAKCEPPGKECVAKAYSNGEACSKAARKVCDSIPYPDKIKCLTDGPRACAKERHSAEAACLSNFKSCFSGCGPFDEKQLFMWCNGDQYAKFCAGEIGKSANEQGSMCLKSLDEVPQEVGIHSWSCEQVRSN